MHCVKNTVSNRGTFLLVYSKQALPVRGSEKMDFILDKRDIIYDGGMRFIIFSQTKYGRQDFY